MTTLATKKLGKGLSALIADDYSEHSMAVTDESGQNGLREIALSAIQSGKYQPRMHFDEQYIKELSESIAKSGVIQPITVRAVKDGKTTRYEIIAGERRWRAAKLAGEITIPAIVKEIGDQQALELALIENVQRQDLTPLEEARGYQRLMDEFSYTQEELSRTVAKSRSHVANLLRLLNLPAEVKEMLDRGELSMGHARALMNAPEPVALAKQVLARNLNVRQTENLARKEPAPALRKPRAAKNAPALPAEEIFSGDRSADTVALEQTLSESLGFKVTIQENGAQGKITLHYETLEQLDGILQRLDVGF